MQIRTLKSTISIGLFVCFSLLAAPLSADIIAFNFQGNGGYGLLPGNEVGANTSFGSGSTAIGGEAATGLTYDTNSQFLAIIFNFQNLTDGLNFASGSGIHLHQVSDAGDPFNSTGGVVFNLNSFSDANVINFSPQIQDGATSGSVTAIVQIGALEDALLNGELYVNIHSQAFTGGELRGNLVQVPEPTAGLLLAGGLFVGLIRRRR